jgi:3-hydroxyisobutyrate dehydrogenase-like beta-hydroxyacid dehydrogenase
MIPDDPIIGFVGLGTMGSAIATRLLEKGYRVVGYNRTRAKAEALEPAGLDVVDLPRETAARSHVCFSMVTDDASLAAVARGTDGIIAGLQRDSIYIELSTVGPQIARELSKEATAVRSTLLDAPVSGSVGHARSGKLSFMVGGPARALEQVRTILQAIGEKITWVGEAGDGKLMKLATNLQVYVQTLAFAESMRLAERGGIDPKIAMEVLLNSVICSPMLQYRAPFMLTRPEKAWFTIDLSVKDLGLVLDAARQLGVSLPATGAAATAFKRAAETGHGSEEAAAIYDAIEELPATASTN